MVRFISAFLFLLLTGEIFGGQVTIKNKLIEAGVYDDAVQGLYLNTISGDPSIDSDDYQKILLPTTPPTTVAVLKIKDSIYQFGSSAGYYVKRPVAVDGKIITEWGVNEVMVQQEIEIVNGISTENPDTLKISYRISNMSISPLDAGLEFIFDSYLGNGSKVAYMLANGRLVERELSLQGADIPQYWFAFDRMDNPSLKIQGTLMKNGVEPPDEVIFSEWEKIYDKLWDIQVDGHHLRGSKGFDCSVALFYYPRKLQPGQTVEYSAYYGLYGMNVFASEELIASISSPKLINRFPFEININLSNKTSAALSNLKPHFVAPGYLYLLTNSTIEALNVESTLNPGENRNWSFLINITNLYEAKMDQNIRFNLNYLSNDVNKAFTLDRLVTIDATAIKRPVFTVTNALFWASLARARWNIVSGFDLSSSKLTAPMVVMLDQAANDIKAFPKKAKFMIKGHADSGGRKEANIELSRKRAQVVLDYFVKVKKFPKTMFIIVPKGSDEPVSLEDSPESRALNRRSEITLIETSVQ